MTMLSDPPSEVANGCVVGYLNVVVRWSNHIVVNMVSPSQFGFDGVGCNVNNSNKPKNLVRLSSFLSKFIKLVVKFRQAGNELVASFECLELGGY
jgi:hypothetical protein